MNKSKKIYPPKFCVLLASFNGEKFLNEQLESIRIQKGVDIDLYISDDNSSDDTLSIIKRYQELHRHSLSISIFENKHNSGSSALNFFNLLEKIDLMKYQAISFADQDDIWHENKLLAAWKNIEDGSNYGYSSSYTNFSNGKENKYINKQSNQKKYDFIFEGPGPGCTFVITQELALKIKELINLNRDKIKNISYHDWFIYFYCRSLGLSWFIDDESYIFYRQHEGNVWGLNVGLKSFLKRIKLILDGEYRNQIKNNLLLSPKKYDFSEYILNKSFSGNLKLAKYFRDFRRDPKEALFLFFTFIFFLF